MRAFGALVGLGCVVGGCAHRDYFDHDALAQTQAADGMKALRVYPEDTIVSVYDAAAGTDPGATIERLKMVVSRNTPGLVVEVDEPDAAGLWVTFDATCSEAACAYHFGRTADGRYRLVEVPPPREGFGAAKSFRGREAEPQRMDLGDAAAPSSANDVYLTAQR